MKKSVTILSSLFLITILSNCAEVDVSSISSSFDNFSSTSTSSSLTSTSESSKQEESSSSQVSSYSSSSSSSSAGERVIPSSGQTLPIGNGNKTVTGPINIEPINIDNANGSYGYTATFNGSLPTYWSAIMGNNKVNNGSFYANGEYKFSSLYYGLQTPFFLSYKKIEIRFNVGQVTNNSKQKDDNEPIFKIFGYNSSGQWIKTYTLDQGKITAQTSGSYARIYATDAIDISYLEFRLNAYPYKSSQCYNFGLTSIQLIGWQYD